MNGLALFAGVGGLELGVNLIIPESRTVCYVRGKPITLKSYKTKLKRNNWKKHLSLVTCEPSDKYVISLVEKWILSLPDSHVNRSQQPENSKEQKTKGGFGVQSLKSLARFDQVSYSWRTFQTSLINLGHSMKFQNPFPKSGSILNGELFERQTLAQTIIETGYSFSAITKEQLNKSNQLYLMPTPTANDATNWTMPKSQLKRKGNLTIAITRLEMLPTPIATEQEKMSTGSLWRKVVMKEGRDSQSMESMNPPGGKMNPVFVEWLMGWPLGWTELERVGME